jgi:hypothetical protein
MTRRKTKGEIFFALRLVESYFQGGLSDGVTVAQGPLEAFVLVRIQVGQPITLRKLSTEPNPAQIPHRKRPNLNFKT